MKVKKIKSEEFARKKKRKIHDEKHVNDKPGEFSKADYPSREQYERAADDLANSPVRTSDENSNDRYIGFKQKDGNYVKFDKVTNALVIYRPTANRGRITKGNLILTYYLANKNKYITLFDKFYDSEIDNV